MTPEEYYRFIKAMQKEEFPDTFDELEYAKEDDGKHFIFAPSHHFKAPKPLITEEIVADLRDNQKRVLSVGCGPAYLERLLVSRLGVKPEQITLADISDEYVPTGFGFVKFDMHQDWPNLDRTFDYAIFPESPLINVNFSSETNFSSGEIRQPDRECGLYNLLTRSLNVLNSPGQARLTCGVADFVKDPVKAKIESDFPNVEMQYSGELTYITKK